MYRFDDGFGKLIQIQCLSENEMKEKEEENRRSRFLEKAEVGI